MKAKLYRELLGAVLLIVVTGSPVLAEPVMRDAATHDELSDTLSVAINEDPMKDHLQATGGDPTKVNQPESIVSSSDFLSFAGRATLVPKRAILHIPANMADRVQFQPGCRVQSWAEFYAMNRGWVTTVEVTRVQAEGGQPLEEELLKRISKSSNLIVATYLSGPISVLPLKVPVETAAVEADSTSRKP